jgi:hypothetical protein
VSQLFPINSLNTQSTYYSFRMVKPHSTRKTALSQISKREDGGELFQLEFDMLVSIA